MKMGYSWWRIRIRTRDYRGGDIVERYLAVHFVNILIECVSEYESQSRLHFVLLGFLSFYP